MIRVESVGPRHFVMRQGGLRIRGYGADTGSWGVVAYVVESPILCDVAADRRAAFVLAAGIMRSMRAGRAARVSRVRASERAQ